MCLIKGVYLQVLDLHCHVKVLEVDEELLQRLSLIFVIPKLGSVIIHNLVFKPLLVN